MVSSMDTYPIQKPVLPADATATCVEDYKQAMRRYDLVRLATGVSAEQIQGENSACGTPTGSVKLSRFAY